MFRRLDSGLPKDPIFAHDLYGLGYFVNKEDEIRAIDNPKAYFKFFITKNERYNQVQREGMNDAICRIIHERLESLGLINIRLPLGAKEIEPHLPIFISADLKEKKKIIVLFYEHTQDLGVFAHRVIGGKGGINKGSAVDFVKYIQAQGSSIGIVLANCGQLRWSRRLKKAITQNSWMALPQKSAVEAPYIFNEEKNTIPGNRTVAEHVAYIFGNILGNAEFCDQETEIQVVGVSEGAVQATVFLENPENFHGWCGGPKPETLDWDSPSTAETKTISPTGTPDKTKEANMNGVYKSRVTALASLGTYYLVDEIKNAAFKTWLEDRGRIFVISDEQPGAYLAGPEGSKEQMAYGAPVFSSGEPYYAEVLLINAYKTVIDWFTNVSADPGYLNPKFTRLEYGGIKDNEYEEMPLEIESSDAQFAGDRVKEIVDEDEKSENKPAAKSEPNGVPVRIATEKARKLFDQMGADLENTQKSEAQPAPVWVEPTEEEIRAEFNRIQNWEGADIGDLRPKTFAEMAADLEAAQEKKIAEEAEKKEKKKKEKLVAQNQAAQEKAAAEETREVPIRVSAPKTTEQMRAEIEEARQTWEAVAKENATESDDDA